MRTSNDYENISQQIPSLSDNLKTMQINPILSRIITNSTDDEKFHRCYSVYNEYDNLDDQSKLTHSKTVDEL